MAMKQIATGAYDDYGHEVYELLPDLNRLGQPVSLTRYMVPPTVGGLCEYLGIHRSTWADYCNVKLHPGFADATQLARGRMQTYREEELLTREGKNVRGVIFDLQANYGFSPRRELEFGPTAGRFLSARAASGAASGDPVPIREREGLLRELAEVYAGHDGGGPGGGFASAADGEPI